MIEFLVGMALAAFLGLHGGWLIGIYMGERKMRRLCARAVREYFKGVSDVGIQRGARAIERKVLRIETYL